MGSGGFIGTGTFYEEDGFGRGLGQYLFKLAQGAPAEYVNDVIGFAKQAFVEGQSFAYMFAAGSAFIGLIITAIWLPARSSGASTIAQQQAPADDA